MSAPPFSDATAGGACLCCGGTALDGNWTDNGAFGWGWRVCRPCSRLRRKEDLICAAVAALYGEEAAETVRAADPLRAENLALSPRAFREFAQYSTGTAIGPVDPWALHAADAAKILEVAKKLIAPPDPDPAPTPPEAAEARSVPAQEAAAQIAACVERRERDVSELRRLLADARAETSVAVELAEREKSARVEAEAARDAAEQARAQAEERAETVERERLQPATTGGQQAPAAAAGPRAAASGGAADEHARAQASVRRGDDADHPRGRAIPRRCRAVEAGRAAHHLGA